jgi:aryl-alcohol dehydrogenase-like predicted oxidoreductase
MLLKRRQFLTGSIAAASTLSLAGGALAQSSASTLITKQVPSTGERLPVIGFGTNRYGTGSDSEIRATLLETLSLFKEQGGTLLDTSSHYRGSEGVLGGLLAELNFNDTAFLSTKAGQFDEGTLDAKLNNSLALLGTRQIDLYQVHNVVFQDWVSMLPVLQEQKQDGKIRYLGITGSEDTEHEQIVQIMRTQPLDFIQINYHVANRHAENEILPLARELGIAVVGNVPFGQGSLFTAVEGVELPEFAKEFGCQSWGNFFLKYNVSHPDVIASIPGTSKPHHALDNLHAATGRLPTPAERIMQEDFMAAL